MTPPPIEPPVPKQAFTNEQTATLFAQERDRIAKENLEIKWRRPSSADVDRELLDRAAIDVEAIGAELALDPVVGAGALRGVVLHRLMEELLTGLILPDRKKLRDRAAVLLGQIDMPESVARPDPAEIAHSVPHHHT